VRPSRGRGFELYIVVNEQEIKVEYERNRSFTNLQQVRARDKMRVPNRFGEGLRVRAM